MLGVRSVSVVIPTRGDCDMQPIIARLREYPEIDDISVIVVPAPYHRYLEMERVLHDVVLTQDDDCLTDMRPVIDGYEPGVICNAMTPEHASQYRERETLIGFGSIFDRSLIRVLDGWERDELFEREADRVFATLNRHKMVFPRIELLPQATAPNRMYRDPKHLEYRAAMRRRIFERTGIR
jgi:hypothetical protein